MYEYFKGEVTDISPTQVIIEAAGVGYLLNISLQTYSQLGESKEAKLYVHQYNMRDDLPIPYGFYTKQERSVFRQLIEVSGVGGNTARTILSTFSPVELSHIIATGDAATLKKVKGLGQKTSEKVIVELRDKILSTVSADGDEEAAVATPSQDVAVTIEAINALQMLGFNRSASEKVVKNVIAENPGEKIEKIIKLALKQM